MRDLLGQRAVEAGDRAEMMEQVGVGAADPLGDRLQRDRGGAFADQQVARGLDRGGFALLGDRRLRIRNLIDIFVSNSD